MVANSAICTKRAKGFRRVEHVEQEDDERKSKGLWLASPRQQCRGGVFICVCWQHGRRNPLLQLTVAIKSALVVFAAVFACPKPHFPAQKIFYDLRLDLRFVCYNGCELSDMYCATAPVA